MASYIDPIERASTVGAYTSADSKSVKKTSKKKAAPTGTTMTGQPMDKVQIDPEIKTVAEAATVQQRAKRAIIMKRYSSKISRARQVAKKRMAGKKALNRRSLKKAKDILRTRFAGTRGGNYAKLARQDKVAVDKMLDKKKGLIKKIAVRIYNKIKQNEVRRYSSATSGKPVSRAKIAIVAHLDMSFKDRVALQEKAAASNLPFNTIVEVFNRGISSWNEDISATKQQYAFARVNSFIAKGKAYEMDSDLHSSEE